MGWEREEKRDGIGARSGEKQEKRNEGKEEG